MDSILKGLNNKIENIAYCFLENQEDIDYAEDHHYYSSYKITGCKNELEIFFDSSKQYYSDFEEGTSITIDINLLDLDVEIILKKYIKIQQENDTKQLKEIESKKKAEREKRYTDFEKLKEEFDKEDDSVLISKKDFEQLKKFKMIKNML